MSDNYPIPTDAGGYLRREAKRNMQQARRPSFKGIKEEVGPGIAPRAVQVLDWNSEETTFNGFFWSAPGVLSSPDPAVRWLGEVWAQDDFNGVQTIREAEPPAGTVEPPPPDAEKPIVTPENPEPEPPTEGNPTPIRAYTRYFSVSPDQSITFTDWEPVGSTSGAALRDLSDVKIFEPLNHHDVLLWNADYNDGEGAWINYSWIPGINDLNDRVDDLLEEFEDEIDFQGSLLRVWRQPEPPAPGDPGPPPVPDPIPGGSIWYDTDDEYHMRIWDPTSVADSYLLHWVDLDFQLAQDIEDAIAQAQADATQALSDAEAAFNAATTASADAAAAADAADQATEDSAAAIEAASLAAILGDNIIANGEFNTPSTVGDPIALWTPANSAALTRWASGADYGIRVTTAANVTGEVVQQGDLGRIPARGGEGFHITTSVATTAGGQTFRVFANTYNSAGAYIATVFSTSQTAASGGQAGSSSASQNAHITIPGNPTFVRFGIQFQAASTQFWVSRYVVAESVGTTRITDDAITTPKINTNAITTDELSADAINVKHTMIAPTYKTSADAGNAKPGILLNFAGMVTYDAVGDPTLTIDSSTGSISMKGSLTSGSTITGATINGATVTGGLIQTEDTINRGVKINSSGMIAYSASGSTVFSIDTTGNVQMLGNLISGSNISGATLTGVLQTSFAANTGVKISNSGIYGYNAFSQLVFAATTAGSGGLTLTGPIVSGGEINGALITGTGIQTSGGNIGIKMNSAGLLAYSSAGVLNLAFTTSTGSLVMKGSLTSGSSITGATITASAFSTQNGPGSDYWLIGDNSYRNYLAAFAGPLTTAGGISVVYNGSNFDGIGGYQGTQVEFANPNWDGTHISGATGNRPAVRMIFGRQGSSSGSPRYSRLELMGDNVRLHKGVLVFSTQPPAQTTTNRTPLQIDTNGFVSKVSSSSRRYKDDFTPPTFTGEQVVALEVEEFTYKDDPDRVRQHGVMAERAAELGFNQWVNRNEDGEPDSFRYDQWPIAQQVALRELWGQVQDLKAQVAALQT